MLFVGAIPFVVALLDSAAGIDFPWFWILLLIFAFFSLIGVGLSVARLANAEESADPPPGCLPVSGWLGLMLLALVFLLVGIGWLLGDADTAGARWTLLPLAIAVLVAGLGAWILRSAAPGRDVVDNRWLVASAATLLLLFIALLAVIMWFAGGSHTVLVEERVVEEQRVAESEVETEPVVTEETDPKPVETRDEDDKDDNEGEDERTDATSPQLESLLIGLEDLLAPYCAVIMPGPRDSIVPVDDPLRATGPEIGSTPDRVDDAPDAIEIERLEFASGGCGDQSKVILAALLSGPPTAVQLSLVIDLPDVDGHVGDPTAPGGIGQRSGWDEFISYSNGGIFQSDHEFAQVPTTAEVVMQDNVVVFVIDRPVGVSTFDATFQSFFRQGDTEAASIIWNTLTKQYAS